MNVSILKHAVYLSIYTAQHPVVSSFQASLEQESST